MIAYLETERLFLRKFTPDDWPDLHEYLSQPDVVRYEPYEPFTEEESRREAARRADDGRFLAVCLKDGGKLIGNIYLAEKEFDTWELGYVFNMDYHGKGYATEAARAAISDAFASRGARRVAAECNPLNEPSWKLLERLGMRCEGCLRENVYFKKDSTGRPIWLDTYMYAILKTEWYNG